MQILGEGYRPSKPGGLPSTSRFSPASSLLPCVRNTARAGRLVCCCGILLFFSAFTNTRSLMQNHSSLTTSGPVLSPAESSRKTRQALDLRSEFTSVPRRPTSHCNCAMTYGLVIANVPRRDSGKGGRDVSNDTKHYSKMAKLAHLCYICFIAIKIVFKLLVIFLRKLWTAHNRCPA